MGKLNRQRRADKRRHRAMGHAPHRGREPQGPPPGSRRGGPDPAEQRRLAEGDIERLAVIASEALRHDDRERFDDAIALLDEGPPIPGGSALVDRTMGNALARAITLAWSVGWQPADVIRVAARKIDEATARLACDVIAADTGCYAAGDLHPRWRDQVAEIGASVWWSPDEPHLGQWVSKEAITRADGLGAAAALLAFLHHMPTLPMLCPPPGEARRPTSGTEAWAAPRAASSPVLERIRALLTKAESTTFPEEAEALSVKAQELMATHSIDRIALAAERGDDSRPVGRRIGIDDPYAPAKSLLLDAVASANRCRSVWTADLGFSTVFGAEPDVDSVDVLFTSLLTQASAALHVADKRRTATGVGRARSFRQSFRVGYAVRIGSRLAEVVASTEEAAGAAHGSDLLPVLASHDEDVEAAVSGAFPGMVHRSLSANNAAGWASGMAAAELASLSIHREVDGAASA